MNIVGMIAAVATAMALAGFASTVEAGELAVEAWIDEMHNEKCFHLGVVLRLDSQKFFGHDFQNVANSKIRKVRKIRPGPSLRRCSDVERGHLVRGMKDVLQLPAEGFVEFWQEAYRQHWLLEGLLPILEVRLDKPVLGTGECFRINGRDGDLPAYESLDWTFAYVISSGFGELYEHENLYWREEQLTGSLSAIKEKLREKQEAGGWLFECRDIENKVIRARLQSLLLAAQQSNG